MLEIAFATKTLRTLCEDEVQAAEELGATVARALRTRLADLRAATHPLDLPLGQPHVNDEAEAIIVDLADGYRLVFRCNHPRPPRMDNGSIAWSRVSRIQLLRIEVPRE